MRLWRRIFVFLPDLDRLVALCRDHPERGAVEEYVKDGRFTRKGSWL